MQKNIGQIWKFAEKPMANIINKIKKVSALSVSRLNKATSMMIAADSASIR